MMNMSIGKEADRENALPPLPPGHDLKEGDRIEMPVYGKKRVRGIIRKLDMVWQGKRYKGLAMLGDDNVYYGLDVDIVRKIS